MQLLNGAEAWPPQGTALHLQQYFTSPINEADRVIDRTTKANKRNSHFAWRSLQWFDRGSWLGRASTLYAEGALSSDLT